MGLVTGTRLERFDALFERHHADVAAYVRRRAPGDVVEDVVAETFLVAWRSLDRIDRDPLPWLYGVARGVLSNELRGQGRRRRLTERLMRERVPQQPMLAAEISEHVRAVLLALSEHEREAVLLVAWEGLTPRQAAVAAGCSAATFRARLHRARRRVARLLGVSAAAGDRLDIAEEARSA